jgi:GTP cyclohydrolase II
MAPHLPDAAIRTQVRVPLRFPDGYATTALVTSFRGLVDSREHLAFACGSPTAVPLVRPHSECLTGDVFGSQRCDCGPQLREAVERITVAGGYVLYLRQGGRGIGLYDKLDAYALQDTGRRTAHARTARVRPHLRRLGALPGVLLAARVPADGLLHARGLPGRLLGGLLAGRP